MFERFTDQARRVVVLAQQEARRLDHGYIGTEHILLGLIAEGEGVAAKALASLDIELPAVREQVEVVIGRGASSPSGHVPFTARAKRVLELSLREAVQLGHNYIGTEHILLGLVREGEGVASQVLVLAGADLAQVRDLVVELLSRQRPGGVADADVAGRAVRLETARVSARMQGSAVAVAGGGGKALGRVVFRRLTPSARRVLLLAESEALRLGHDSVGVEHLLLGLLAEGEGGAARALGALGLDLAGVRAKAERILRHRASVSAAEPDYREDVLDAIERALHEALTAGSERIDTEHLLLGIVHQAENRGGRARAALQVLGTPPDAVRQAVPTEEPPSGAAEGDPGG